MSIAPRAEKKMIHAPYPPTTPTMNIRTVATVDPKLPISKREAKIWADVRSTPPIKIVFLGPYLLNR